MLISENRKFIYLAVPKTGSTSIETHLMSLDPEIKRNTVPRPNGTWVPVHKHAKAAAIKEQMRETMHDYTVVAFIRSPISTAISKYYYYRVGRGAERARLPNFTRKAMGLRLRVLSTLILPLRTWVRLYPYSMMHEFLLDDQKNLLVDVMGDFGNLQAEFERIFVPFGFEPKDLELPMINKTKTEISLQDSDQKLHDIVAKKARIDTELFNAYVRSGQS